MIIEANSDFSEFSNDDKSSGLGFQSFLNYRINQEYRTSLLLSYDKGITNERAEITNDARLSFIKSAFRPTDKLSITPMLGFVIPTSEVSRKRDELYTAAELSAISNYNFNDNLSLSYIARGKKYFHQYETNNADNNLPSIGLLHILTPIYAINDQWSITPTLVYFSSWNYLGTRRADFWQTLYQVNYATSSRTSYSIGLVSGGRLINNERGPDDTFNLFDKNTSSAYINMSRRF